NGMQSRSIESNGRQGTCALRDIARPRSGDGHRDLPREGLQQVERIVVVEVGLQGRASGHAAGELVGGDFEGTRALVQLERRRGSKVEDVLRRRVEQS